MPQKKSADDAGADAGTIIKKYANRRLYNTGTSTYVTLEDLAEMVKGGEEFVVKDAKSGADITHSVLTQIIFEQEAKGENLLPITFLRQIIRFYGDSMQSLLPSYLDQSINSFVHNQATFREQLTRSLGTGGFTAIEDQVKRNAEMFEKAIRMFSPFPMTGGEQAKGAAQEGDDIDAVKERLAQMERRLEELSKSGKG